MLASWRENHQLIKKKDMIPTPSQPIRNWNILFAVIKRIMENKKISKYLKKLLIFGSVLMYHDENSIIDHETNRAIGVKIRAYLSIARLILISMFVVNHQFMVIIASCCVFIKYNRGIVLNVRANLMIPIQFVLYGEGSKGYASVRSMRR